MKPREVYTPSPATERLARWAELEEMITALQELGWRLEKLSQSDEPGEPLRAYIRVALVPESVLGEIL